MEPLPQRSYRYMEGFRCLGPDCEDPCCVGWSVVVDSDDYERVRRAMTGGGERARFEETFVLLRRGLRTQDRYAAIDMSRLGHCPLWAEDGLCSLHKTYGEAVLPTPCAMYPRFAMRLGDTIELAGSLSCPEVARRALASDAACALVEADPSTAAPPALQRATLGREPEYAAWLEDLRETVERLLFDPSRPALTAVALMVGLAMEIDARATEAGAESPAWPRASELMGKLARIVGAAGAERAIPERVAGLEPPLELVVAVVGRTLRPRGGGRAHRLAERVIRSYAADADAGVVVEGEVLGEEVRYRVDFERLRPAFVARRAAVEARFAPHLDAVARRFFVLFWQREWPEWARGLRVHAQRAVLAWAVIRFLVLSEPAVLAALAEREEAAAAARFDAVVVEAVSSFLRLLEHTASYQTGIEKLAAEHLDSFERTLHVLAI